LDAVEPQRLGRAASALVEGGDEAGPALDLVVLLLVHVEAPVVWWCLPAVTGAVRRAGRPVPSRGRTARHPRASLAGTGTGRCRRRGGRSTRTRCPRRRAGAHSRPAAASGSLVGARPARPGRAGPGSPRTGRPAAGPRDRSAPRARRGR